MLIAERMAPCGTGDLRVGGRRGHRGPLIEEAIVDQPRERIATAIAARQAAHRARRQEHAPAGVQQILGDLHARLPAADHEHGPGRQLIRAPVSGRVELEDRG